MVHSRPATGSLLNFPRYGSICSSTMWLENCSNVSEFFYACLVMDALSIIIDVSVYVLFNKFTMKFRCTNKSAGEKWLYVFKSCKLLTHLHQIYLYLFNLWYQSLSAMPSQNECSLLWLQDGRNIGTVHHSICLNLNYMYLWIFISTVYFCNYARHANKLPAATDGNEKYTSKIKDKWICEYNYCYTFHVTNSSAVGLYHVYIINCFTTLV